MSDRVPCAGDMRLLMMTAEAMSGGRTDAFQVMCSAIRDSILITMRDGGIALQQFEEYAGPKWCDLMQELAESEDRSRRAKDELGRSAPGWGRRGVM